MSSTSFSSWKMLPLGYTSMAAARVARSRSHTAQARAELRPHNGSQSCNILHSGTLSRRPTSPAVRPHCLGHRRRTAVTIGHGGSRQVSTARSVADSARAPQQPSAPGRFGADRTLQRSGFHQRSPRSALNDHNNSNAGRRRRPGAGRPASRAPPPAANRPPVTSHPARGPTNGRRRGYVIPLRRPPSPRCLIWYRAGGRRAAVCRAVASSPPRPAERAGAPAVRNALRILVSLSCFSSLST